MVNLAQRKSVADDRLALLVQVGEDVGRIKQLRVTQVAHRAAFPVRLEYTLAEGSLVKSLDGEPGDVSATHLIDDSDSEIGSKKLDILACNRESAGGGIVRDDHCWPQSSVLPAVEPMEIDQRPGFVHGATKPNVVV